MTVNKVDVGNFSMIHPCDLSLNRHYTGLMNEAKPNCSKNVERIPQSQQRSPTVTFPPELVCAHENNTRKDGNEKPRFLMLHKRKSNDGNCCRKQCEGKDGSNIWLVFPLKITNIAEPIDDGKNKYGCEGSKKNRKVD